MADATRKFQTKLLDEQTQLIVKYFVDSEGNLRLNDPSVQVAFFNIAGVKDALLAEATKRDEECEKKNCN